MNMNHIKLFNINYISYDIIPVNGALAPLTIHVWYTKQCFKQHLNQD
ncbi:hypothetical protein ECHLIB_0834 [Ehrlichia chaffeensis str. Liberty]|uniref:Uncharacterized protein n=1 Tax=Ehrlichia chaffeensis (strain ATCC CRL-10679 / Arkansas) TaxID=205920 RepID=Q2GHI9_EHRCR|nr:hypothetical protein ECH_0273 [Ehrlichia chaffeensis str. Arkansas]AHX06878.1 hypothetical protein ECHLIB_0834 [Ehrlichia chaffeensis str. Liberty]AHX07474.1 hypothetical protein ECHOSC_0235 [Ehrlichia chaffeensis str. Osceola]